MTSGPSKTTPTGATSGANNPLAYKKAGRARPSCHPPTIGLQARSGGGHQAWKQDSDISLIGNGKSGEEDRNVLKCLAARRECITFADEKHSR